MTVSAPSAQPADGAFLVNLIQDQGTIQGDPGIAETLVAAAGAG